MKMAMASASCSYSCIPNRELLFCCPKRQFNLPIETTMLVDGLFLQSSETPLARDEPTSSLTSTRLVADIFTSRSSFRNHLFAPGFELLVYGKTPHRLSGVRRKRLGCGWEGYNQISRRFIFEEWSPEKGKTHLIKAIATVEPKVSVKIENDQRIPSLQFKYDSESQETHASDDDSIDMDEKERLRRMRISKANKGNVPWNKGRKHSPETLQQIREKTKIAMQDPKVKTIQSRSMREIPPETYFHVKMKLVNLGHAQSEETRVKIGAGVREGWQRRREMLMVQERCLFEWQNMVAGASRKGYTSEDELQWDSYKIIDKQLQQEWLESIEKRKMIARPKGSKRAPKSPEQRRKISEAISAKWADPEYRGRVCSALAKYHGVPVGVERKRRRRPSSETSSAKRERVKKKSDKLKATDDEAKSIMKVASRRKRNATPSYKDSMASAKLEMIRKIRAERAAIEDKRKEATERAKLLIAEAEKAAKALEMAALKSPLAQASLIETRKLIAEATRSIESIESGQLSSHECGDEALITSDAPLNHFQSSHESNNRETVLDERISNGFLLISSDQISYNSSDQRKYEGFDVEKFTLQNAPEAGEPLPSLRSREDEVVHGYPSPSLEPYNVREDSGEKDLQGDQPKINGSIKYKNPLPEREGTSESKKGEGTKCATKTKKWVCGRLVEVDD